MSLSAKIRDQIISNFRVEIAEHLQTLNEGLLTLEQKSMSEGEVQELLGNLFRSAHSMKGAARAVGVTAIEQMGHALEDILSGLQKHEITPSHELLSACYKTLDAIQDTQDGYEKGEISTPIQVLQCIAELESFRKLEKTSKEKMSAAEERNSGNPPASDESLSKDQLLKVKLDSLMGDIKKENNGGKKKNDPQPDGNGKKRVDKQASTRKIPEVVEAPTSNPISSASLTSSPEDTIRIRVRKLDSLMAQLSELLVTKINAQQRLEQALEIQQFLSEWQKDWQEYRNIYSQLVRHNLDNQDKAGEKDLSLKRKGLDKLLNYVDASQDRVREINNLFNGLVNQFRNDNLQMGLVIDGLEEEIKRVRMLPFSTITGAFPRMVRDLGNQSGKQVVLEIHGSEVELDKQVLENIKDPLIHLLRNAVDHGIEPPEKRIALGKPATGTVTLSVEYLGKEVAISISDDGEGIDIESIREQAISRGIQDAATLDEPELTALIYQPGFSTSNMITDVSGRGVGLDVVRRKIEDLHGRISLDWTAHQGSHFTLFVPLALTSSRALVVQVSNQLFAVPLTSIERIVNVKKDDIEFVGGYEAIKYNDRTLTLNYLSDVLELPRSKKNADQDHLSVIIFSSAEKRMAFVVDNLVNEQEVVIKSLGRQLSRVAGIAGASVMGNGSVLLILHLSDLMKLAQNSKSISMAENLSEDVDVQHKKTTRHILVVDDSITTRTLEKNILEAAGYSIRLATNGQEALNLVSAGEAPDLIISDVSMPKMDGFGLCKSIKGNSNTSHIPVVLVTSLNSSEDKARGIECGADAYIIKSSFNQDNLLETISQLI